MTDCVIPSTVEQSDEKDEENLVGREVFSPSARLSEPRRYGDLHLLRADSGIHRRTGGVVGE